MLTNVKMPTILDILTCMSRIILKFYNLEARSNTNWALQAQKMARGLKFPIQEVEELYYL